MNTIDTFLEEKAIEKFTLAGAGELIAILFDLSIAFISSKRLISKAKKDISLSRRLRNINDKSRWKVFILDDKKRCNVISVPEVDKNIIYVTNKMTKILDDDELMAVLLHESLMMKMTSADFTYKHGLGFLITVISDRLKNPWIQLSFVAAARTMLYYSAGKLKEYESDREIAKYGYREQLHSALKKIQRAELIRFKSRKVDKWAKRLGKDKSMQRRIERLKDKETELANVKTEKDFLKVALSAIKD